MGPVFLEEANSRVLAMKVELSTYDLEVVFEQHWGHGDWTPYSGVVNHKPSYTYVMVSSMVVIWIEWYRSY